MTPAGLRRQVRAPLGEVLSEADAEQFVRAFVEALPEVAAWQERIREARAGESRSLIGRRSLLGDSATDAARFNAPVKGTVADGLKRAIALLWERREQCAGAVPVLVAHDQIVVECDGDRAPLAGDWLRQAMVAGLAPLLRPVPVAVKIDNGRTWVI